MKSKYCILIFLIVIVTVSISQAVEITSNGFLNVNSDPIGLKIYLDGDSIGRTPIQNYALNPSEYSVSLFSSDSIEEKYWKLTIGGISSRFSSLLDLTKIGAATQRVVIKPNKISPVFFSVRQINRTPTKAKLATTCCLGTGFSIAFLLGFLIAHLTE